MRNFGRAAARLISLAFFNESWALFTDRFAHEPGFRTTMFRFAVLADPHYHEIFPGYGIEGVEFRGRTGACIRTRADSAASTRIFNESAIAFPAALDQCVAAGICNVIVVGDLTDDGQIATMDAALALLALYESKHGMRFFLTPGNMTSTV
jgi:hypothetical protein